MGLCREKRCWAAATERWVPAAHGLQGCGAAQVSHLQHCTARLCLPSAGESLPCGWGAFPAASMRCPWSLLRAWRGGRSLPAPPAALGHGQTPLGSPSALQTTGPGWGKHVGLGLAAKMIYFDFFWLCSPSQGVTWLSCVRVYFPSLHSCRKLLVWEYFGLWRRDMVMAQPVLH